MITSKLIVCGVLATAFLSRAAFGSNQELCRRAMDLGLSSGNIYFLSYLDQTTDQCVGNCVFHADLKALSYLHKKRTGETVRLNPADYSLFKMLLLTLHALYGVSGYQKILSDHINPNSDDVDDIEDDLPERIYQTRGFVPEGIGITDKDLPSIAEKLQNILKEYRKSPNEITKALAIVQVGILWNQTVGRADSKFVYNGREYTAKTFTEHLHLDNWQWIGLIIKTGKQGEISHSKLIWDQPLVIGAKVGPSKFGERPPPEKLFSERGSFEGEMAYKYALKMIRDTVKSDYPVLIGIQRYWEWARKVGAKSWLLPDNSRLKEDSTSTRGHRLLVGGIQETNVKDDPVIFLQNSHGYTTLGVEGVFPVRYSQLRGYMNYVAVPYTFQSNGEAKSNNQLGQ